MILDTRIITALSLVGTTLDALGGFYLTYDLLGSKYGPLRTIVRVVTYSFICATCFWPLLGFWFGVIGAVALGPLLALENVRHGRRGAESRSEALTFQGIRAVALGLAGWLAIDVRFGVAFGLASLFAMYVLYYLHLSPADTYRASRKPELGTQVFAPAAARGVGIGLAGLLGGALADVPGALKFGIEIGLVVGALNALTLTFGPSVEWWAENLSGRSLGAIGAMLAVIGFLLQSLQYALPLAGFGPVKLSHAPFNRVAK
jgi:hypothetical protein